MKELNVDELLKKIAKLESKLATQKINVRGGSKDPNRGKWCTPKPVAEAVGPFDHDPFSNPHSHIVSAMRSMLENGGDGFGDGTPGSFYQDAVREFGPDMVGEAARTWIQPPYELVMRALQHYGHTRFTALLRFDPRTKWFRQLYRQSELVCVFRKIEFEPPPGVKASTNSYPHALYYRRAEDVTDAVLRMCIAWRTR